MRYPLEVATASRGHFVKIENRLRSDFVIIDPKVAKLILKELK